MLNLSVLDSIKPFFIGFDDIIKKLDYCYSNLDLIKNNSAKYSIIKVSNNDYRIELAFPGHNIKDLEILIDNNILTINATKPQLDKKINTKINEVNIYSNLHQKNIKICFYLEKNIIVTKAKFENGILAIKLYHQLYKAKAENIPIT